MSEKRTVDDAIHPNRHYIFWTDNETFKTTDFLGQGAFGEVYRAAGETSGRVVAIKLLPLGAFADADSKIALLNEINTAQQIRHPNVVQVLFVNDGNSSTIGPYAVMEYVSGGSLASVLRAGTRIPLERAIEMMIDIAQGTKAINEKLIHRDIKPDNILIEGSKLRIGDSVSQNSWMRAHAITHSRVANTEPTWHRRLGESSKHDQDRCVLGWLSFSRGADAKTPAIAARKGPK